jgi:hypothetical protein
LSFISEFNVQILYLPGLKNVVADFFADALHSHAAMVTLAKEIPRVLLGLRLQPRKDIGLSLAEAVFDTPLVLPNEFLQFNEFSIDQIF